MSDINWLNIEIYASVNDDDEAEQISITAKVICPRKGEYVWMPFQWEHKEKWGTNSFMVDEVCHHISPNIKGTYDSIKIYCTPVTDKQDV